MRSLRFLRARWPILCLFVVTISVSIWAGAMVREVIAPKTDPPQVAVRPLPLPTSSIPAWVKTAPSLGVPTPTAAPPLANPSALPSQGVLPKAPTTQPPPVLKSPATLKVPNPIAKSILPQARYGHLPYNDAASDRLVNIGTYGEGDYQRTEYLDRDAAAAFDQMVAAAKAEGLSIVPISGFRTIAQQEKLFQRQIQRQGSESAAATLSAPPGFSEHHSGYALDIGDGAHPKTDVKFEFEETAVYQWMVAHAKRYGFELSFPRNNRQGVSFEPWHWRFVNSGRASAIFAVARTLEQ
jgi:zinc D-Ala-D-Ala carboxypeptidase